MDFGEVTGASSTTYGAPVDFGGLSATTVAASVDFGEATGTGGDQEMASATGDQFVEATNCEYGGARALLGGGGGDGFNSRHVRTDIMARSVKKNDQCRPRALMKR